MYIILFICLCYFLRAVNYKILVFKNLLRRVFGPVDWLKGNYVLGISWFFCPSDNTDIHCDGLGI
jgi:hypothetical protein